MKIPLTLLLLSLSLAIAADQIDRYPDIRKILEAAETASTGIQELDDRSRPAETLGQLYARAGYLNASARAYARTSAIPFALLKARAVYGDSQTAMKEAAAITNPEQRLNAQLLIADVLWRMGESENARKCIEEGRKTTSQVADPALRSKLTASLEQTAEYLKYDPPNRLSATPTPRRRSEPNPSSLPPFPITPEGLGPHGSTGGTAVTAESELITDLYARVAAHDRDGIIRIVENAATPFQKTLALASLEHLLIQQGRPEIAESYAAGIPDSTAECVLAKAEAFNSVAAEWLRKGDVERAKSNFESALKLVKTAEELPLGQVRVIVEIAETQGKDANTRASAEESLKIAEQIALKLPIFDWAFHRKEVHPVRLRYRHEAYQELLIASVKTNNLAFARHIAGLWQALSSSSGIGVVGAWLSVGRPDEAITFAAGIENKAERVKTQLSLARGLLDEAGAPNI